MTDKKLNHSIKIYFNPECSKCQKLLAIIDKKNINYTLVDYLKKPLTIAELKVILNKMNLKAHHIIKENCKEFESLGIANKNYSDEDLIKLISKYPNLMNRPIIETDDFAFLCRPPEKVNLFL